MPATRLSHEQRAQFELVKSSVVLLHRSLRKSLKPKEDALFFRFYDTLNKIQERVKVQR